MSTLDFSPTSLLAEPLSGGSGYFHCVRYSVVPEKSYGVTEYHLIVVTMLQKPFNTESTTLGKFKTAHHAALAAMEHWQEFEERINSALPGEAVAVPEPHWATVPKTTIVSSAEIRRELDEAKAFAHDLGGES